MISFPSDIHGIMASYVVQNEFFLPGVPNEFMSNKKLDIFGVFFQQYVRYFMSYIPTEIALTRSANSTGRCPQN